jgi:hypothetical protein
MPHSGIARFSIFCVVVATVVFAWGTYGISSSATYVGSKKCAECHEKEYSNYTKFSKKAHSSHGIKLMASDLDPDELKECYECHTTGYGKPGGFVSFEQTPEMENDGCEVCHGPGSLHIEDGDPEFIKGELTQEDCYRCHTEDRIEEFNFRPMIFGGAH